MPLTEHDPELLVRCRCGDLAHMLSVWFEADEQGYDDYEISLTIPWMPWRYRVQQAWRVLRGRPGTMGFVSLSADDLHPLIGHMLDFTAEQGRKQQERELLRAVKESADA